MASSKQADVGELKAEERAKSFSCTMQFLFFEDYKRIEQRRCQITNNLDRRKRLMTISPLGSIT